MTILLAFLLGLSIGLALWMVTRVRLEVKLKKLLRQGSVAASSHISLSRALRAIAQQQQAYHEIEAQLEIGQQLLQVAPIGYLQVDDENQLQWCNQQAIQLLGIQGPPLSKPRLLLELVRSYELDELIELTRQTQKLCQKDWTLHPATAYARESVSPGPTLALRGYGVPLVQGQVGIFLENRQEVVVLATQRDRAFSDVAHELKTPLTSIRLVAETLQSRVELPLRNWVDRLLNEAIRLSNLVQVLLDLSQLEKGGTYSLNVKTFDLSVLIQSAWLSLEPLARQKQLQLHYQGPDHLLMQADEHRIFRVLLNLLDNGIKYSPPQQQIWVKVSLEAIASVKTDNPQQQVHLEVIDAGEGFPESALNYVFERFYRVEPSRTRSPLASPPSGVASLRTHLEERLRPLNEQSQREISGNPAISSPHPSADRPNELLPTQGSGLGLAIVRQIVEAHHGSVSASNHPETGGAWLQVFLPWNSPNSSTSM